MQLSMFTHFYLPSVSVPCLGLLSRPHHLHQDTSILTLSTSHDASACLLSVEGTANKRNMDGAGCQYDMGVMQSAVLIRSTSPFAWFCSGLEVTVLQCVCTCSESIVAYQPLENHGSWRSCCNFCYNATPAILSGQEMRLASQNSRSSPRVKRMVLFPEYVRLEVKPLHKPNCDVAG